MPVNCPKCNEIEVTKHGKTAQGKQRYRCQKLECARSTFICDYSYAAYSLQVQRQIGAMAINGSGIRDTARVLGISPTTVINTLKKSLQLPAVNLAVLERLQPAQTIVRLCLAEDSDLEAEVDEMWSFVQSKRQQRWLWWAIDHISGEVLAYVLADRKDKAFIELKSLLEPFGITQFYSDGWGAYQRHIAPELHTVGKRHTQKIERKHLTLAKLAQRAKKVKVRFKPLLRQAFSNLAE